MKKVSTIFLIAAGFLLLAMSCSSEKPEQSAKTGSAEVAKPAVETTTAAVPISAGESDGKGEALFKQHCIKCHKGGGNIITPEKTIRRKDLAANNINTPEDIVRIMRNPGPKMKKYDETILPDDDAKKIGEYILKTFQ